MTREQLDEMFEKLYPAYEAAETSLRLADMLDDLIVAVWEYQDAHKLPKCCEFERVLAAAAHMNEQYTYGPRDAVKKEYHERGLDLVRHHDLRMEYEWKRQDEERKAKAAKPKKAKAPKVKLAKAA